MNYLFHTELAQPHQPAVKAPDQFEYLQKGQGSIDLLSKNVRIGLEKINCYPDPQHILIMLEKKIYKCEPSVSPLMMQRIA